MPLESPVYTGPVLTTQAGTLKRNDNTWSSGQTTAGEMWQPPSVDQREYQNSLLNFDRPRHLPHDGHAPSRPPPLGYVIRDKKLRILLFWCFILVDCALVPTGLYFVLWYEAGPGHQPPGSLDANTVLSIVTATIGGTSVMEWAMRCWRLWKKDSDCRVIGATSRWQFDWFQWWFGLCILVVVAELVLGTAWPEPNRQLLALPLSSVQAIFGLVLLTLDILHLTSTRCPLRISSTARGSAIVPPGIYPVIEDICAVSGGGGTAFRMALARRYAVSPVFRRMLSQLGCFWTIGTLGCASGTAYLVLTLEDIDLAYALGWTLPFAWGMLWSVITITYVRGMLAKEQQVWAQQVLIGLVAP